MQNEWVSCLLEEILKFLVIKHKSYGIKSFCKETTKLEVKGDYLVLVDGEYESNIMTKHDIEKIIRREYSKKDNPTRVTKVNFKKHLLRG